MKRTTDFRPHDVSRQDRADGSILLRSNRPLGPVVNSTGEWLHRWAVDAPNRVFLAERSGAGWRTESYAATLQKVQAIACALLARGMGAHTPILILSGNGVDHALLSLAAHYIGVPTVPVAEQYSQIPAAHGRLVEVVEMVRPAMVFVSDASAFCEALKLDVFDGIDVVASCGDGALITLFGDLERGDGSVDLAAAHARVGPETIAKILMTSGSTSAPKGVLTTQKMMCSNQAQLADALPFLRARPPQIVDWLPWNHVFGGSHNFNMMLANGGSLYIDDGKPAPGLFDRTLENLHLVTGSICFNVPVGFQMLHDALQLDHDLCQRFFENLDMLFYAGASLPQQVWNGFEDMAMQIKGEVPLMTSSWGLTETGPAALMQQEPTDTSGVVGVPLSGMTVKLVPYDAARFEVRAKGPNFMTAYLEAPEQTRDAFDEEGFFVTGDAMRFVDADHINAGLRFDGRISEDFKLLTGTWVRAAQLRIDLLARLAPIAADLVVVGADRGEIGLMIFPDMAGLAKLGMATNTTEGALDDPRLLAEIQKRLMVEGRSSSTHPTRAIVLAEPASMPEGEMTAKGNLNFRKILERRAGMLSRLYGAQDPCVILLQGHR